MASSEREDEQIEANEFDLESDQQWKALTSKALWKTTGRAIMQELMMITVISIGFLLNYGPVGRHAFSYV